MNSMVRPQSLWQRAGEVLTNQEGFTLLEVLVALTIFSVVGVTAFSMVKKSIVVRERLRTASENQLRTRRVLDMISRDLSCAYSFDLSPFQGEAGKLQFVTQISRADGSSRLRRVRYFVSRGPDEQDMELVRSEFDFQGREDVEVLLPRLAALELSYRTRGDSASQWLGAWEKTAGLPGAVRVKIQALGGDQGLATICPVRVDEY